MEDKVQKFIVRRKFAFVGSTDKDGFSNVKVMLYAMDKLAGLISPA